MDRSPTLESVYAVSQDVVARDIDGKLIIVPLFTGQADMENEFYTLNETGRALWLLVDGKKKLSQIVANLTEDFDALPNTIEAEVLALVQVLLNRKMLIEVVAL
jgi:hypothetical protein